MSDSESSAGPSKEDVTATFREAREYARGELDVDHADAYPWMALVSDPIVREVLAFMKSEYDPRAFEEALGEESMPRRFEDTEFFTRAIRKYATETGTRAVRDGNVSQTAYLSGLPSYKSDISGLHAINRLSDWLIHSEQCKLIYAAALMGRGKTDFALLLFEIIYDHFHRIAEYGEEKVRAPEFAANFHAETPDHIDASIEEFHSYSGFLEWAEGGSSDLERWFIFDEASTELTAQSGANAQDVAETFAPFVKKMRKLGINMIVIGHDRGDVHPAIRSIASFVDKSGLKTAEIYEGIKRREPFGHYLSVSGVPQTSWSFDTDDVASWEWDVDVRDDVDTETDGSITTEEWEEWRDERMAAIYANTALSYREVGDLFGVSKDTVRRRTQAVSVDSEPVPASPVGGD